jgi:hypothetical protein
MDNCPGVRRGSVTNSMHNRRKLWLYCRAGKITGILLSIRGPRLQGDTFLMKLNSALSISVATAALTLTAGLAAFSAEAVTKSRTFSSNAVALCQSALPVFDGLIRKRPLAVQNEGTSNAFVTCAFTSEDDGGVPYVTTDYTIWARSNDGVAHDLSCTGVTGHATGSNEYVVKTVNLPADGSQRALVWSGADFADHAPTIDYFTFAASCNLSPGVGLNDTYVNFTEDVGS